MIVCNLLSKGQIFQPTRGVKRQWSWVSTERPIMARLNLDFSNVQSRDPLPEGTYPASVAKVEQVLSKSSGNPMLKVEFNILDEAYAGRKVWGNYVLTEAAMWKVQELFSALGLDTDAILDIDTDDMVGMTCNLKIAQREYEGNIQNEIKKAM